MKFFFRWVVPCESQVLAQAGARATKTSEHRVARNPCPGDRGPADGRALGDGCNGRHKPGCHASSYVNATAPVAKLYLTITDANDQPITGPLAVGQTFYVDFSVQDLRSSLSDAGIEEAGTTSFTTRTVVTPTGTVTAGPNYPVGLTKDLSTAGTVSA